MNQKQWLLDYDCLRDLLFALDTEIKCIRANGIVGSLHLKKQEELQNILRAAIENTTWTYDEETGERLRPAERIVLSLVEDSGEWWSDPYAVVPVEQMVGKQRWAVIEKGSFRVVPVGEKTYSQKTHAYRRCRQLNAAARDAFDDKRGWFSTPVLATEEEAKQ